MLASARRLIETLRVVVNLYQLLTALGVTAVISSLVLGFVTQLQSLPLSWKILFVLGVGLLSFVGSWLVWPLVLKLRQGFLPSIQALRVAEGEATLLRDDEGVAEEKLLALLQDLGHHFLRNRILDPPERGLEKLEDDILRWESKVAEALAALGVPERTILNFRKVGMRGPHGPLGPQDRLAELQTRVKEKIDWLNAGPLAPEGGWRSVSFGNRMVRFTNDAWAAYRALDANQKSRIREYVLSATQQRFRKGDIQRLGA